MVQNFGVEYYGNEGDEVTERESENKYYANTGATGEETKEIALNIATMNNNNPGYGIIKTATKIADATTFITPDAEGQEAHFARPEEVLLETARTTYGRAQKKLRMVVSMEARTAPHDDVTRPEWSGKWKPAAEAIEWAESRVPVTLLG